MINSLEELKFWARLVIVLKNHKSIRTQKDFLKFIDCKRTNDPAMRDILKYLKENDLVEIDEERQPYLYEINPEKMFKKLKTNKYQKIIIETMIEPGIYKKEKWE